MRPGTAWIASLPLQGAGALARRLRRDVPELERPCLSVGNLAVGGRGKTPVVAALARAAVRDGLRPAILSRGYGGRVRRRDPPELIVCSQTGPPWLHPVRGRVSRIGDEPAWLAAVCPEVPVAVHPRRDRAAAAVLARGDVDLFLLDDGFQSAVARDLDIVLLDPALDPPYARQAPLREGGRALSRAQVIATVGMGGATRSDHLELHREPDGLVGLTRGEDVDPSTVGPVVLAAGVGRPEGVVSLARRLGLEVRESVPVADHGRPGPLRRLVLARASAVLVTEKDAMGWAAERPPCGRTLVLRQRIAGIDELWKRASSLLPVPA